MTTEVTLAAEQITEQEKQLVQDAADAARYRFLLEHCSWRYPMTQDSPMECGITFHIQELEPNKQGWDIQDYIDAAIKKRAEEDREAD